MAVSICTMHGEKRGLVISLSQATNFPSGGDHIDTSLYPSILKIADSLRALPNRILLEGHTDSTITTPAVSRQPGSLRRPRDCHAARAQRRGL